MVYCTSISPGVLIKELQQCVTGDHRAMDWNGNMNVMVTGEVNQFFSFPLNIQGLSHSRPSGGYHPHTRAVVKEDFVVYSYNTM